MKKSYTGLPEPSIDGSKLKCGKMNVSAYTASDLGLTVWKQSVRKPKETKDDRNFHCTFLHSVKYIFVLENKGLGTGLFPETQRQEGLDSPDSAICISGVGAGDRILPAAGKVQARYEAGGKLLAGCSAVYDILHSDSRAWKIPSASCIQSAQRQDMRAAGSQDSGLCMRNTHHMYILLGSGKCETCEGDAL